MKAIFLLLRAFIWSYNSFKLISNHVKRISPVHNPQTYMHAAKPLQVECHIDNKYFIL